MANEPDRIMDEETGENNIVEGSESLEQQKSPEILIQSLKVAFLANTAIGSKDSDRLTRNEETWEKIEEFLMNNPEALKGIPELLASSRYKFILRKSDEDMFVRVETVIQNRDRRDILLDVYEFLISDAFQE